MDKKKKEPEEKPHKTTNRGYGYHGEMFRKHQGDKDKANNAYAKMAQKVHDLTGEKDRDKVCHYLDSLHGRHLPEYERDSSYVKLDFARFNKRYNPQQFMGEGTIEERSLLRRSFNKTFKDSWPDKSKKANWKDVAAEIGYASAGTAAGAATGSLSGLGSVPGAVIGGAYSISKPFRRWRSKYRELRRKGVMSKRGRNEEQEMKEDLKGFDLLTAILDEKPHDAKESLNNILTEKLEDMIECYKAVLAESIFGRDQDDIDEAELEVDLEEALELDEDEDIDLSELTDEELEELIHYYEELGDETTDEDVDTEYDIEAEDSEPVETKGKE